MSDKTTLGADEVAAEGLADWTFEDDALHAQFETGDFATGLRLVNRIGEAAESANHHPDLVLTYPHVDVTLSSQDAAGVTSRDVSMARQIS
ncbi:MAG: 4a-hydroxytetrahydrobiopterin dehydratase, partial [Nocardioides sp.]